MAKNKSKTSETVTVNLLPISILLAAIIISATILFTQGNNEDKTTQDSEILGEEENNTVQASIDDDPYIGNKEAATVAIIEFSDFQCGYCKQHADNTLPEIKTNYVDTGDVIYVFRDFQMYEDFSEALSMVTECVYDVADQDTYALFHTQAFEIADAITSDDNVESVLNNAYTFLSDNGVDTDDVKTCMENSNTDEMSVDWDDAIAIGIGGTPAFVVGKLNDDGTVDGVLISDAQAYSKFQEVIDSYL